MTGAAIGAVVGGLSAVFGGDKLGKRKVLGRPLSEHSISVGPFRDPNLPWILLARASLLYALVSERNHARRDAIKLKAVATINAASNINDTHRRDLDRYFAQVRKDPKNIDAPRATRLIESIFEASSIQTID